MIETTGDSAKNSTSIETRGMVLVVDTETTGFAGGLHTCLIEIGAVLAWEDTLEEISSWGSLVRPRLAYDPKMDGAFRVNRLDYDDLTTEKIPSTVFAEMRTWLQENNAVGVPWYAYNTRFDAAIVKAAFMAAGVKGRPKWSGDVMKMWEMYAALHIDPMPRKSLATAIKHFGIVMDGPAHRAVTDARATLGVWRAIRSHGK